MCALALHHQRAAADDQLPQPGSGVRPRLRPERGARGRSSTSRSRTRWASAATTAASCSAASSRRVSEGGSVGRQLAERVEHDVRERERVRRGRVVRVRDRDHAHAGRVRGADPVRGVLDGGARAGLDAEPPRRLEIDVRRRLAARDLLRRDRRARRGRAIPARSSTASISGRFEDDATAERELRRQPPDRLDGAVDQRQVARGSARASADDLGVDLLRRLGEPDLVVHVRATTRASSCPSSPPARPRASARRARARAARARRPRPAPSRR